MPRKKFDRSIISKFTTALDSYDDLSSEINLKELIEQSFEAIERSVKKKASWNKIVEILHNTIGSDMDISPNSVRNYYLEIQRTRRQEVGNKKSNSLKNKQSKRVKSTRELQKSIAPVTELTPIIIDVDTRDIPIIEQSESDQEEVVSAAINLTTGTEPADIALEDEEAERIRIRREKYGSKITSDVQEAYPNFNFGPERK